ncbi:MAG: hypothetical protein WA099_05645 [Sulfuricurvum sp.]
MRGEVKRWYQTKKLLEKNDIKESISNWINIIFKFSILLGAFISLAFFSFYVNVLPSIGNIGDFTTYFISIALLGFFIILSFLLPFFAPFWLKDFFSIEENIRAKQRKLSQLYILIFPFVILGLSWLTKGTKNDISIFLVLLPLFFALIFQSFEFNIKLNTQIIYKQIAKLLSVKPKMLNFSIYTIYKRIRELIRLSCRIQTIYTIFEKLQLFFVICIKSIHFILYSFIQSFFPYLFFLLIGLLGFIADSNNLLLIIFLLAFVAFINISLLQNKLDKKFILAMLLAYFLTLSFLFSTLKIDNPIITMPFKYFKLGYYNSELRFKEDFINKSNPFLFNESNQTSNTFFILSSIGDEYILRETRQSMEYNESNISHHTGLYPFDYNGTRYYCEDNNQSLIWVIPNSKNKYIRKVENRSRDFNETIEKQLEYWKIIDRKTYRIKKDNVEFEVVGTEIENQSTIWEHNAKN